MLFIVRGGGIPAGLGMLLQKLGLVARPGEPGMGAHKNALKGTPENAEGKLAKGTVFGEEGALRAGLGYAGNDRRTSRKNVSEKANVDQFLKEMQSAKSGEQAAMAKELDAWLNAPGAEAPVEGDGHADIEEQARETVFRRDDARQDARVQGQQETAEAGEMLMADIEPEGGDHPPPDDQEEEEDRPGAGWLAEELEGEEDDDRRRGLKTPDAIDERSRCRHDLPEGGRCLRRAVEGTPYCRAHGAILPQNPSMHSD